MPDLDTVIVDVDGTLVDSSYHHVIAWSRAFHRYDVRVDLWRLHRHMGMGGDRLVAAVAGDDVEQRLGDALREHWKASYDELLDEIRPFDGAAELLAALADRGLKVVLATSGKPSHTERALEILGLDEHTYPMATAGDADRTKPAPDLIDAAMAQVSAGRAVVVGDTVWDVKAAQARDLPAIGLLVGGLHEDVLRAAGAVAVYESPRDLLDHIDGALSTVR